MKRTFFLLLVIAETSFGQTLNWTPGLASGDINVSTSWSGLTPSSSTDLLIGATSFTGAMTTINITVPTGACAANNFSIDVPAGKTVNLNFSLDASKLTLNGSISVSGTGTLNIIGSVGGELTFYNNSAAVKTHSFTATTFFKGPDLRFRIGSHVVNGVVDMNNVNASDLYVVEEGSQTFITNVTFNAPVIQYQPCPLGGAGPSFSIGTSGGVAAAAGQPATVTINGNIRTTNFYTANSVLNINAGEIAANIFEESSQAANPLTIITLINSAIKARSLQLSPEVTTFTLTMDNQSELVAGKFTTAESIPNSINILGQGKLTLSSIDNYNSCGCTAFFMSDYGGNNASFFNLVNVKLRNLTLLGPTTTNIVYNNISGTTFQTDTIDVYTNWRNNNSFNNARVNKLFRLNPGASLEYVNGNINAAPISSINLTSGCQLQINGTCAKPCYVQGHIFNFSTPAAYTSTVTYATIINSSSNASPAIPCVNSSFLNPANIPGMPAAIGAIAGFSGGAPPVARTLFWLGTTPIASKDNYQRWNNPANWSLSSGGPGGECPPTMRDSVVFPNGSLVRLDDSPLSMSSCGGTGASSYVSNSHVFNCKSMVWQGSGDIYDSVPNVALFNTSSYPFTAATGVNELRIHGSLICPPTFSNNFHGNVVFAAWQSYPQIQTSNVSFNRFVIFRGMGSNAKWTLMDTLKVDKFDCNLYQWYTKGNWELQLHAGYLNTNGFGFVANAYGKYQHLIPSVLDIRNSKCYLTRAAGYRIETFYNQGIKGVDSVKAIPSHIIFTNPAPDINRSARFVGGGYKYDTLTFKGLNSSLANYVAVTTATFSANRITDSINRVIAEKSLVITTNAVVNGSNYPAHRRSFVIKRADIATKQASGTSFSYNALQNNQAYFDSLYLYCDGQFNKSLRVNKLLYYNLGHAYNHTDTTVFGINSQWIIKTDCGAIGGGGYTNVKNGKFYKPAGGNGDMGGPITTTLSGTPITTTLTTSINGVLLENCTVVPLVGATPGVSYSLTNSSDLGGNTPTLSLPGWIFQSRPPRNLLWVASTPATTADMWQDCNNWALCNSVGVQTAPAPNAPPFETDNVWFTDASFTNVGDTVRIDDGTTALFKTMRWTTTTKNPVFKGDLSTKVWVYGSIYFSTNMQTSNGVNNYMQSSYTFRGTDPANVLDTKGKIFAGYAYFNADANTTQWTLSSDYNNQFQVPSIANSGCVSGVSLYTMYSTGLLRGKLVLNGNRFYCRTFISNSNKVRTLDITNSTMHIQGKMVFNPCFSQFQNPAAFTTQSSFLVRDSSNVMTVLTGVSSSTNPSARPAYTATSSIILGEVSAGNSTANGMSGIFSGGGKRYNLVHFVNGGGLYNSSGDTIMRLKVTNNVDLGSRFVTTGTALQKNQQNTYIGAIYFLSNAMGITPAINITRLPGSPYGRTLVVDSIVANGNVDILDSIHIRSQYKFGSGNTYNYKFAANKTCYLSNLCDFKPVGSSFAATMNFNSTIAGSVARIRKDSGLVCVGYLNIRDIQAVGNGQSLPAFATAPQSTPIGPFTTPHAFYADTVWASSYYTGTSSGSVGAAQLPTSGRAVFSLDNTADISQSPLNRGWEIKGFGIAPSLTLTNITPTIICGNDSIKLTFTGYGGLPLTITYSVTGAGTFTTSVTNATTFTSYNNTTGAFIYEPYIRPVADGTVSAKTIQVVRCFNDLGSGTGVRTFSVKTLPSLTVSASSTSVCAGNSVTLSPGGATTYTLINTNAVIINSIVVMPLATTVYSIQGSISNGCSSVKNTTVNYNPLPLVTAVPSSTSICSTAMATLTAGGANSYTWTSGPVGSSYAVNATGVYTVTGTDLNNCVNTNTVSLLVNPSPTVTAVSSSTAVCFGSTATLTAGGANSYTWTSGPVGSSYAVNATGVYTVTGTDLNNCTNTNTVTLTINALPIVTAVASNTVICTGDNATLTAGGANTYTWAGGPANPNYTVNMAGTYTVAGTDVNNCVNTKTIALTVNALPIITAIASNTAICIGTNATLTAGGANTYTWAGGPASPNYTVNTAGTYTVAGTDINNCTNTNTVALAVNALPSVSVITSNTAVCVGNTATLAASGANTYSWTGGPANPNYTVNTAGTYTVTGTDINNCTNTSTVALAVNALPSVTVIASNTAICIGTNATLTAGGANTYTWTGGAASPNYTVNLAGTYTVTGTDVNNCVNTKTIALTVAALPIVTAVASNTAICAGLNATLTAGGANTYSWTAGPANPNYVVNTAGTYTVTGRDTNNCTNTNTVALTVNALPGVSVITSNTAVCAGNTATLAASGANTYSWTGGPANPNYTVNTAGTYTVTGTDINNCTNTNTVALAVNALPSVTVNASNTVICIGTNVTLTAGGANTYTWAGGPANPNYTVNLAGTYTVTGTDVNNCVNTKTIALTVTASPIVTVVASNTTICSGTNATLTASGATTYSWSNGVTTASTAVSPLSNQIYTVSGLDGTTGCFSNDYTLSINVIQTPSITALVSFPTICSGTSVSLTCNASTATTFTWSGTGINAGNENLRNPVFPLAVAGTYIYNLLGENSGCISAPSILTITVVDAPLSTMASTSINVCEGKAALASIANPQVGVVYTWAIGSLTGSGSSFTIPPAITKSKGIYPITVNAMLDVGNNTCKTSNTGNLTVNASPMITVSSRSITACENENLVLAVINPLSQALNYTWFGLDGNSYSGASHVLENVTRAQSGIYTVTVADANGCENSDTVFLTVEFCEVKIPQLVSPNGDGINDVLVIKDLSRFPNNTVQIYNRWGNLVFESKAYQNNWQGNNDAGNGGKLPAGTYFVLIDFGTKLKSNYKGYIQLEY